MKVLAVNPGHDGAIAFVDDGRLVSSYEAEKDSSVRHSDVHAGLLVDALLAAPAFPDIVAVGGWFKVLPNRLSNLAAGYHGLQPGSFESVRLFGAEVALYTSSHERSHVVGGLAMSPYAERSRVAVLVWEGQIGAFYDWRGNAEPPVRFEVLTQPGARFAALFALADPTFPDQGAIIKDEFAGKLMALAGCADQEPASTDAEHVVASILRQQSVLPFHKHLYRRSVLYNCGHESAEFRRAARLMTDRLFAIFAARARDCFEAGLPLVVVGGCGLNCEWNTRWRDCGYFSDVFVPPCPNDSGSAIGTAMDASIQAGGSASLEWSVYSGPDFVYDVTPDDRQWRTQPFAAQLVVDILERQVPVAWIEGACEIGPRALGHRSLLASATDITTRDRLNAIKQREEYRPIAPVCLESDVGKWFDDVSIDPYMLYFRKVRAPAVLPAITHADGTARVQTLDAETNPRLHAVLETNRDRTGIGVLCNTSLNFSGRGFINRMSDLLVYCDVVGIRNVVTDSSLLTRRGE